VGPGRAPPPPPPRTKWTRRVPHPVLIGHVVCLVWRRRRQPRAARREGQGGSGGPASRRSSPHRCCTSRDAAAPALSSECRSPGEPAPRQRSARVAAAHGRRDAACPISTGGGTRRVRSVREGGGGRGADAPADDERSEAAPSPAAAAGASAHWPTHDFRADCREVSSESVPPRAGTVGPSPRTHAGDVPRKHTGLGERARPPAAPRASRTGAALRPGGGGGRGGGRSGGAAAA